MVSMLALLGLAVSVWGKGKYHGNKEKSSISELGITLGERCTCALSKDVAIVIDSSDSIDLDYHGKKKWNSPQWQGIETFVGGLVTRGQKLQRGDDWMVVQYGKAAAVTIPFGLSKCDTSNPAKCRT